MPTLDEIKLAMASTNALFSSEVIAKRNFDALDHIYTADARILPPGAPMVSGREAIKTFWSSFVLAVNATSGSLSSVEIMEAGDSIVEIGAATLGIAPDGQAAQVDVKYVVYWRQEDGLWKWHVDIWNASA